MTYRVFPINSAEGASVAPGLNDYDLLRIPTQFLTEGVVESYGLKAAVTENSGGANMTVQVGSALMLIEITNTNLAHGRTYKTWFESDDTVTLSIAAADATNTRIDRIVAQIDVGDGTEGSANPNAAASDIGAFEVITGTPDASPTAPAEPANAKTIALVAVAASATSIVNANITDSRTYVELNTNVLQDVARTDNLASTANGKGAGSIGVEDSADNFAATNVEAALAEIFNAIPDTGTIQQTTLTAGETLSGATLPVPVYQDTSDEELYACDANDNTKYRFIGFVVSDAEDEENVQFQGSGVIAGFSGLTVGARYYVQDTAGTIGTTPGTQEILVGAAISATQLLIVKQPLRAFGTISDLTTGSSGNNDETVTLGFRPRLIVLHYYLQGSTGPAGSNYAHVSGIAKFIGTTLSGGMPIGASGGTSDNVAPTTLSNSVTPALSVGTNTPNGAIQITLSINSVTDTGFVIRRLTDAAVSAGNARAKIRYEAYE